MIRHLAVFFIAVGVAFAQSLSDPARATLVRVCSGCHDAEGLIAGKLTRAAWQSVVDTMMDLGAKGTDADVVQIVDYLVANFGLVNVNTSKAKDLAKELGLTAAEGEAIVAYRTKNGSFATVDALKKIQGVDPAKIEAAKERIVF